MPPRFCCKPIDTFRPASGNESPPREELARQAHIPLRTFVGKFHAASGLAPSDYLKAKQVTAAVVLLIETDLSVAAVGYAAGFGTRRSFASQFHRRIGASPAAFRKAARKFSTTLLAKNQSLDSAAKDHKWSEQTARRASHDVRSSHTQSHLVLLRID